MSGMMSHTRERLVSLILFLNTNLCVASDIACNIAKIVERETKIESLLGIATHALTYGCVRQGCCENIMLIIDAGALKFLETSKKLLFPCNQIKNKKI